MVTQPSNVSHFHMKEKATKKGGSQTKKDSSQDKFNLHSFFHNKNAWGYKQVMKTLEFDILKALYIYLHICTHIISLGTLDFHT